MAEILPWLNLLLIPVAGMMVNVAGTLGAMAATQKEHGRRLEWLEARA